MPHHVTQRGNRGQPTFFGDDDYAAYLELMGEPYLLAAARYIELNPVRAGLVVAPRKYRWSSTRAHRKGKDDGLVRVRPLLEMAGSWRRLLTSAVTEEELKQFREHERTGRVLGSEEFQERLEKQLGRLLRRQKPGPKKASKR
jgi:putative transposase